MKRIEVLVKYNKKGYVLQRRNFVKKINPIMSKKGKIFARLFKHICSSLRGVCLRNSIRIFVYAKDSQRAYEPI